MKTSKILSLAVAVATALAAGKALGVNTNSIPVLNISGTMDEVKSSITNSTGKEAIQTTKTVTINNAYIMGIITNALLLHAPSNSAPIIVPAKSYLVFNPDGFADITNNDYVIQGVFYVTNKTDHFYFPLSGFDTNGAYYSYAELDTPNMGFDLSFYAEGITEVPDNFDDFNLVSSYNQSLVTNTATESDTQTAVLYIHDNPYAFDAADTWAWEDFYPAYPDLSSPNPSGTSGPNYENSIEMQGVLKTSSSTSSKGITSASGTFTGSGNALINGSEAVITSGKATVTGIVFLHN